jgi:hypothetical protein
MKGGGRCDDPWKKAYAEEEEGFLGRFRKTHLPKFTIWIVWAAWILIVGTVILTCIGCEPVWAAEMTASYYSVQSCKAEGTINRD